MNNQNEGSVSGYTYGQINVAHSPLSMEEVIQLEQTVGWGREDEEVLKRHTSLFKEQGEMMVDCWRAKIGAQPHLARLFFGPDGKRDEEYAGRVKKRFVQWVIDVATRPHDRAWVDYQEEIGLRHTPEKKNKTDSAHSPPVVPLRYLVGFIPVVILGAHEFFAKSEMAGSELEKIDAAWTKAVVLHVTLWTRPYVKESLW